jgi:ATP phosphoribosyltransferase
VKEKGPKHVKFSTTDGALKAAPAMSIVDAFSDLVSDGTTVRENNQHV